MGFVIFILKKLGLAVAFLITMALLLMYGVTMFGILSTDAETMNARAPNLRVIMYTLTALWVGSLTLFALYNSYNKGEFTGRFPMFLGVVLLTTTVLGGAIPFYYSGF